MQSLNSTIEKFRLPRVGQIGIVLQDLEEMLPQYSLLLNLRPWFRSKTKEQEVYYRGKKIDIRLDLRLAFSGSIEIEVIGANSNEENVYTDVLNKGGGLHHLGFFVNDFDKRLQKFKSAGYEVLQQGQFLTYGGSITKFAYLDTIEQCGVILELIESKIGGRIPVPHTKFMMGIGSLTGDVEKLKF